jgi:two-component system, NarL family, nitrate/nitrite response regulator NarL
MKQPAIEPVTLRTAIISADMISGSGLYALLTDQEGIQPVVQLATAELRSLDVYDADVALWDFGLSTDVDASTAVEIDFSPEGELDGVPVLGLVSDVTQSDMVWRAGVRSILLRSAPPKTLISALHATAHRLWTLSPRIANEVPIFRSGEPAFEVEPLTLREREVLNLMAEGLTNRAIAQRLSISEHTVKFHVNSILGKLDAQSRTDAVVRASRAGLILL